MRSDGAEHVFLNPWRASFVWNFLTTIVYLVRLELGFQVAYSIYAMDEVLAKDLYARSLAHCGGAGTDSTLSPFEWTLMTAMGLSHSAPRMANPKSPLLRGIVI